MFEIGDRKMWSIVDSQPETLRGGCLDSLVKTLSLGYLGVETTATIGLKDEYSGRIFQGRPEDLSFQTGEVVYVADLGKTMHNTSRRIVRNHKT